MRLVFSKRTAAAAIICVIIVAVVLTVIVVKNRTKSVIVPVQTVNGVTPEVIGYSVEGRKIESYTFLATQGGKGKTNLVFVGGIHGGYEWNSVLLAYKLIDYLTANPEIIPKNLTVTVIPNANPDGLYKVVPKEGPFTLADIKTNLPLGTGRFNANNVDLNRNFDCQWQATSTWKTNIVSAGTAVFSEPEAKAIRDFVFRNNPIAMVFLHSQSNAVYASRCENDILPGTLDLMNVYSQASGYPAVKTFTAYVTTGAVEDWLASINIPAITVELSTHESVEWDKNLAGIKALLRYYDNRQP